MVAEYSGTGLVAASTGVGLIAVSRLPCPVCLGKAWFDVVSIRPLLVETIPVICSGLAGWWLANCMA